MTPRVSIRLTPDARRWALAEGGAITLRASRRAGCCGGGAMVPVAEIGAPADPASHHRHTVEGVIVFEAPNLHADARAEITIGLAGFLRWKRLIVEGLGIDTLRAENREPFSHDR